MEALFKALGHPVRRRIVALLRDGPLASGEIAERFELSWPTITSHLSALREAGLVASEKEGVSVRYRLEISAAEEALGFLLGLVDAARPAAVSTPETILASKAAR